MIIDVKKNEVISERPYGVMGFTSFYRLAQTLQDCGEVRKDSEITHFIITDRGIEYRLKD